MDLYIDEAQMFQSCRQLPDAVLALHQVHGKEQLQASPAAMLLQVAAFKVRIVDLRSLFSSELQHGVLAMLQLAMLMLSCAFSMCAGLAQRQRQSHFKIRGLWRK